MPVASPPAVMTTKNFCRHCSVVPAWKPDLMGFTYPPGRIKKTYMYKNREKTPQTFIPRATLVLIQGGLCIFPDLLQFLQPRLNNYAMLPSVVHVVLYFSMCLNRDIDLWGLFIPHEIVPFHFSCSRICLRFCSYWKTLVTDILFSQGTRNQSFFFINFSKWIVTTSSQVCMEINTMCFHRQNATF